MDRGRGRGRASNKGRRSQFSPDSHSHLDYSDSFPIMFNTPTPPTARHMSPQQLSQTTSPLSSNMDPRTNSLTPRSERPARSSSLHYSFSFESPKSLSPASAGPSTRTRTRGSAMGFDGAADDNPIQKGGHSLRKRSRVDYTQELVDDDFAAHESKSDAAKKPASVTTAHGRKRHATQDLSGDETDNTSVTQKRRRLDKEPGPRSSTTRRKTSSRKATADSEHSADRSSSDNDVQDTILVGVPMDGEDDDSESSKNDEHVPSQRDTPRSPVLDLNGHDSQNVITEATRVQKLTLEAEESPTLASESQALADDKPVLGTPLSSMKTEVEDPDMEAIKIFKSPTTMATIEGTGTEAEKQPLTQPVQSTKNINDAPIFGGSGSPAEPPVLEQQSQESNSHSPVGNIPNVASLNLKGVKDGETQHSISKNGGDQEAGPSSLTTTTESLGPQAPQPKRLPQLDPIYSNAQRQSYYGQLAPYDDEDVVLPGSWTEHVHPQVPQDIGISTPAPSVTPLPTPPPREPVRISDSWDGISTLTHKQFFSLYREEMSRRRSSGQPRISMLEFREACARRRKEALEKPKPDQQVIKKGAKNKPKAKGRVKRNRTPASSVEADSPPVPEIQLPQIVAAPTEDTPRPSPAPESQPPTAAPSPEPEVEVELEENQPDMEQEIDAEAAETETETGPVEPETVTRYPKKQYSFKKLPDIAVFEEALKDPEEADDGTLYKTLESSAKVAQAWQNEYLELKKITDDEDNAKRRAQNDKAIENWDARQRTDDIPAWRRTFDEPVQKVPATFDVKGVRAPKPYIDDPVQEHQREMDKIAAQAYGFDHKGEKSMIGKQDPIAQRFETSENRLRDRKQTQKAADAAEEGVILEGKRARKPRIIGDQSAPASRATTPVPGTRQRQRKTVAIAAVEDHQAEAGDAAPELAGRKRTLRVKSKASEEAARQDLDQNGIDEQVLPKHTKVTRKRTRPTAPHPLATTTYAEPQEEDSTKEEWEPPKKRQRKTNTASNGAEIPAGSFYSQTATEETQRPSTSSSSGTANTAATVESSYSLRDKKKRNFAAENDPTTESRPKRAKPAPTTAEESQEPPKKRVRQRKKAPAATNDSLPPAHSLPPPSSAGAAPSPGPMMHTFSAHPDPAPTPAKKPLPKIKLINGHNGSAAAGPARAPAAAPVSIESAANRGSSNGSVEPPEKPYSEMSKSEKMSYSMRRRWAAGEMQGAVEKRKNTLARKAEAKATAPPPDLTPKPLQPATGPPAPTIVGVDRHPPLQFQEHYMPPLSSMPPVMK